MSLGCTVRKIFKLSLFLSLLLFQGILAQGTGTVRGTVIDKISKDALPGANLIVAGTSIGAATDLDGKFVLRNIPAGKQTIKISYIGYMPESVVLTIAAGSDVKRDFALEDTSVVGKEIVITAQAQGQLQAINQQLSSNKIANIVSEARIQELPDFNAAQAISRLPGIATLESSGEANKIVIRGLAPQFNQVSVGGISLSSTGSTQIGAASQGGTSGSINTDRSVDLSMISPYMIKSISVYKSLTPDLNANAIGGVVNMELREAPSGLRADALWQSGYTDKSKKYGNYRSVLSLSNRFINDAVGVYVLGNMEQYDRDADNMLGNYTTAKSTIDAATGYRPVQVTNVQLNRHLETRKRYGVNAILDYKFSTGTIRSINLFSRLDSDFKDYFEIINYKDNALDFRYRAGNTKTDVGVNSLEFTNDFGFMSMEIKAAYTYSKNSSPNSPFFQFRQTGSVTTGSVIPNTVPEILARNVAFEGASDTYLNSVSLFSSKFIENDREIKGDFKFPMTVGDLFSGFIKVGGLYRQNKNTNDQSTPFADIEASSSTTANTIKRRIVDGILARYPNLQASSTSTVRFPASNFTSTDSDLYETFLDNSFGKMFWMTDPTILTSIVNYISGVPEFNAINSAGASDPGGWSTGLYQTLPNDYDYRENYSAAYIMSEVNVGEDLMITGGIRYENVAAKFDAWNLLDGRDARNQTAKSVSVSPTNHFYLPMVTVKYDVNDWVDVRYAYTQTLARPDYNQLSPHYNITYDHNNVFAGNPDLRPAHAFNQDFIVTLHSNEIGLLSVGGFYKEIKDFTFSTTYRLRSNPLPGLASPATYGDLGSPPLEGATLNTFMNNTAISYVRGVEFDFQTRFWYLPFPFDGLLMGVNYAHINSDAVYPYRDEQTIGIPGRGGYIRQIDSTRSGRLINQPNDIGNLFVGFDYRGFSAKVSFVYQGNSVSNIGAFPEQDGFTDDYFRTDISVRQMMPWDGLQLFLDVNNLNNRKNIAAQESIKGFTNQKHYGLTLNLGVRYSFGGAL